LEPATRLVWKHRTRISKTTANYERTIGYNQAIEKFENKPAETDLKRMRDEHIEAMTSLSKWVEEFGGEPATGSGPWGTLASAVTGAAKVIGPATALDALKRGEDHGVSEYEKALTSDDVSPECKEMILAEFLPQCHKHIAELDRLAEKVW
jgi:uncharacterized protein (TIGR02284 family)